MASRRSSQVRREMRALHLTGASFPIFRLGLAVLAAAGTASALASLSAL